MTTKTTELHLLNPSWREYERHQRREEVLRIFWFVAYSLACLLVGVGLGMMVCR